MEYKASFRHILIVLLFLFVSFQSALGGTIYVDASATGANNGSSWENAYIYLQNALAAATSGDQIWVAKGTYKPDRGNGITPGDRNATFQLKNGVSIYGGFPTGGGTWESRDPNLYQTILTGDLAGNDLPGFVNNSENSYHVIAWGVDFVVDGCFIVGGNANGADGSRNSGGGVWVGGNCVFRNCTIQENSSSYDGGGVYAGGANCVFSNCIISKNRTTVYSGNASALVSYDGVCTLVDCTVAGNDTQGTSTIFTNSSLFLVNCILKSNIHRSSILYSSVIGGGLFSTITVNNCTIINNIGCGFQCSWNATLNIYNTIIARNSGAGVYLGGNWKIGNCTIADNALGGIDWSTSHGQPVPSIKNCILWGNNNDLDNCVATYSCIGDSDSGIGNIHLPPLFQNPSLGDYHLVADSPCINMGDTGQYYLGQTDIDGEPRVMGGRVDMGADEYPSEITLFRSGASVNLWEELNPAFSLLDSTFDGGIVLADGFGLATAEYLFYLPKPSGTAQQIKSISVTINGDNPWLSTPYAYIGTDPTGYSLYWNGLEYSLTGQAARNLLVDANTIDSSDNIGSVLNVRIATFDVLDRYDVNSITVKYWYTDINDSMLENFHKAYSAARFLKTFKEEMVDGPYSPWNGNPNEQRFFMGINRANAFAQNLTGLAEPLPKAVKTFIDEIKILYSLVDLIDEGFDYFNFLLKYDTGVGPYGDGPQPVEIATSLQNASDALNTLAQSYQDIGFHGLTDVEYPTLSTRLDDALTKLENLKGLLENSKDRLYNIYHDQIEGDQTAEGLLYSLRPLLWYDFDTTSITLKPDSYLLQLIQDVNAQASQFVTADFGIVPSDKGLHYTVDGNDYTINRTFVWLKGNSHQILAPSVWAGNDGYMYEFGSWSDGNSRSHNVAPVSDTSYTVTYTSDKQAPTPNPMSWVNQPYAVSSTAITMVATQASDPEENGVSYYFECTAGGGHNSGWQDDRTYTDSGLQPNTIYTYTVKARDKSLNAALNTTIPSSPASVLTYYAGDIDSSGLVNLQDLKILADQWLQPPSIPSADIAPQPNGDGIVNFLDFALMAENWMK